MTGRAGQGESGHLGLDNTRDVPRRALVSVLAHHGRTWVFCDIVDVPHKSARAPPRAKPAPDVKAGLSLPRPAEQLLKRLWEFTLPLPGAFSSLKEVTGSHQSPCFRETVLSQERRAAPAPGRWIPALSPPRQKDPGSLES